MDQLIRVANAPCSWGVIENVAGDTSGYGRVLDEMAEAGYAGTELGDWGFMPTDPDALRAELDSRGLALLASFSTPWLQDPARHRQGADDAVRIAKLLAAVGGPDTMIVLGNDPYGDPVRGSNAGRITPAMGLDDAGWEVYAAGANDLCRRVRDEAGIRTVVHQHLGTLIETGAEVRRLMAMTDPDLLGICLDTGHWTFGTGENPADAVREFGDLGYALAHHGEGRWNGVAVASRCGVSAAKDAPLPPATQASSMMKRLSNVMRPVSLFSAPP